MAWRQSRESIRTLQDAARADLLLWLFCTVCGHAERMSPFDLAGLTGKNSTPAELRRRLKCRRCGKVGHAEVFPSEQRATGDR